MKNKGKIIAADVSASKIVAMERQARRLGITNIEFLCADGTKRISNWDCIADRVLCDVPCSGLGIIRKKPDIRYKDLSDFSLMNSQREILKNGLSYLKPTGKLVYSTCTINPAENQGIISFNLPGMKDPVTFKYNTNSKKFEFLNNPYRDQKYNGA
jgi:16S rRNA (cytosine967-C5)-methyltransferase